MAAPPVIDALHRPAQDWLIFSRGIERFRITRNAQPLADFAEDLARTSQAARFVRGYYQLLLTRALGEGSHKVVVGRDGFLFLREELDLGTGTAILGQPEPRLRGELTWDSVSGIIHFERQLRANGIHLVVVPATLGPILYPEKIWPDYPLSAGPAWNEDFGRWLDRLRQAGVDVVDVAPALWQAKHDAELPLVPTDNHWSPHGVEVVARTLAEHIRPLLGPYEPRRYEARPMRCTITIDMRRMLDLPPAEELPPYSCTATQVLDGGHLAVAGNEASVLLMGDSFSAVYSGLAPEDPAGADLVRALMRYLGAPVQSAVKYGVDPLNARAELWGQVPALLQKKVIVWEFSARHLPHAGTWKPVPFPPVRQLRARRLGG